MHIHLPKIKKGLAIAWGSLGFYRGVQSFNYGYQYPPRNNPAPHDKPFMYMYSKALQHHIIGMFFGFAGSVVYIVPTTGVFMLSKEIYRLEVNLRGLEEEKSSDFYNRLLL
jgi:hypothetical protein